MRYKLRRLEGEFTTDTFYAKQKSLIGNICSQLFSTKFGFNTPYRMLKDNGEQIGQSLNFMNGVYQSTSLLMEQWYREVGTHLS